MRPTVLAGLALLVAPAAVLAQTGPYTAVVADAEVAVRAGSSDKYDVVATLKKGDPILVIRDAENGWVAVQNPPGKVYFVSWVLGTFIDFDKNKPTPQAVMVNEQPAPIRVGQLGLAQPSPYSFLTVPSGTGLSVIGTQVQFERRWWYPVLPPEGDVRYLPKQALTAEKPVNTTVLVRDSLPATDTGVVRPASGAGGPAASLPAMPTGGGGGGRSSLPPEPDSTPTTPTPPATKPPVQNPLWAQAETAERDGRLDDAEKLYFQLARTMNEPGGDHDIANLCYTRIHSLREKKRAAAGGTASTPRPAVGDPPSRPAPNATQSAGGSLPPLDAKDDRPRWTGPGQIKRSALALEGHRTYVFESSPGVSVMYVVGAKGVDLEKFVGKKVDLYGVSSPYGNLSKPCLVATDVQSAP